MPKRRIYIYIYIWKNHKNHKGDKKMIEKKMLEVLRRMQDVINAEQMIELNNVLTIVFSDCEIVSNTNLMVIDDSWEMDLEDFLISKSLEGKSDKTVKRYRYELKRLLSSINKPVSNITSENISLCMMVYKKSKKISNQTLKNVRAIYSAFFSWLRDRNRISVNPMMLVEEIKVEKKIKKPYSDEERERLMRECDNLRDKALLEFLYSTGIRVSELVALNISDIRFSTKDLIVLGKGNKERVVYLNDISNLYLKEYLESRTDDNDALFVSKNRPNKRLTTAGVEWIIKNIGNRAGVEKSHPHRFRRTTLTNALNRGMPLQEVMILAGHSKAETTMLYCTVNESGLRYHHQKCLSA